MNIFRHVLPLVAAFGLFLCVSDAGHAADTAKSMSPSAQFVQRLGDKALNSLTAKDLARPVRENRVRELLNQNFDIQTIGRFALGTYWRSATEVQKAEYMRLFEDMIVKTYTTRFEDYSGQSFQVTGSIKSGDDDIVSSKILQKDGPPVNVAWRVRSKGGTPRVVDVIVENISMSVTQRSDFSAVIQGGGGKVDTLLASLRDKKKAG